MDSVVVRETLFKHFDEPTSLAWSTNGNLVAIALPPRNSPVARVAVVEPEALHEHTVLEVPVLSGCDSVDFVSFAPLQAPLTLLTATRFGSVLLWTPRPAGRRSQPVAVNTWSAQHLHVDVGAALLYCKFLEPVSQFQWPPRDVPYQPSKAGVSLDHRFLNMDHVSQNDPAWIRTSILHILTVDVDGALQVHWSGIDSWQMTQCQSLGDVVGGKLLCADAVVGRGSTLMIAVVSEQNPLEVRLLETLGYPRPAEENVPSFEIEAVATVLTSIEHPICSVRFRPGHMGNAFVALHRSYACVAVSKHVTEVHETPNFTEVKRAVLNINPLKNEEIKKIAMTMSTDGTCLVLCVPGMAPSILSMRALDVTDRFERDSVSSCTAAVFSPNGVCLAGVVRTLTHFQLIIWSLSEMSTGAIENLSNRRALSMWDSMRLTWALLRSADPWDICQRIQHQAQALPQSLAYFSLFYVDGMLHRHTHQCRPHFADQLDKIKIRILLSSQDPAIQVVLMDLYSRRIIASLLNGFNATFLSSSQSSHIDFSTEAWTEGDKESCRRWTLWLEQYVTFLCSCLKTWTARSLDSSEASPSLVPFVRLLGDNHFIKRLSMLSYCFNRSAGRIFPPATAKEKYQTLKEFCDTIQQIHSTIKKANPYAGIKDQESPEAIEAFRELVSQTRIKCPGPVHLHYARLDGPVNDEVRNSICEIAAVKNSEARSQTAIQEKAMELGLLPDPALKGLLFMKETERQPADCFPSHMRSALRLPIFDCLHGGFLQQDRTAFYAVDQSCTADFSHFAQGGTEGLSRLDTTLLQQCAMRSPFTGCLWKKLHP